MEFDPTKRNPVPGVAQFKRPMGQIVIQWDPNSQGLGFQVQGLTAIEEMGVVEWFRSMRMKAHLSANDQSQVIVAPAGSVPPPPKVVS